MATVGSIPDPESTAGQIVKVALIVFGVGTLFYVVTVTEFFVSGHLAGLLEERRTLKKIDSLKDHILICGFGRVGRQAARDLRAAAGTSSSWTTIRRKPGSTPKRVDAPFVEGSPSDDEVLRSAGIMRAAGVIACVDSDAENIFITLTARELRSDITIVARASVEDSEASCAAPAPNRIVSPYKTSGSEMVRLTLQPQVTGVVEVAARSTRMEEIEVTRRLRGGRQDPRRGPRLVPLVALRHSDGRSNPNRRRHGAPQRRRPRRDRRDRRARTPRAALGAQRRHTLLVTQAGHVCCL